MKKKNNSIVIVGDLHGHYRPFLYTCASYSKAKAVIQVGDFGFGPLWLDSNACPLPENVWFIRGNHDDPNACRSHSSYLGDFGVRKFDKMSIGFIGGAWSIDRKGRREGVSIWHDEELSIAELQSAIDLIVEERPKIIITHDCPEIVLKELLAKEDVIPTRTGQALDGLFNAYQPALWVFGHHHVSWDKEINGTKFVCLDELEAFEVSFETEEIL